MDNNYKDEIVAFDKQKDNISRLWNIGEKTASILYSYVISLSPKRILEIGTSNGYSTFWLSIAAEKCGAFVESIEVDENRYKLAMQNLKKRENIVLHLGLAEKLLPSLINKFDFIFIDAGKIGYISYIKSLLENNKISDNAVIIADNVISHKETTQDYIDFINNSQLFESIIIPIESGILVAKFNRKKRRI